MTPSELVSYYDDHPEYWSVLDHVGFDDLLDLLDLARIRPGPILDLGCGDGRLTATCSWDQPVDGIDVSSVRLAKAADLGTYRHLVCGDLAAPSEDLPVDHKLVVVVEVLEHLADPIAVLGTYLGRLPRAGRIIGTVPINHPGPGHLQVWPTAEDAAATLAPDRWVPILNGRHIAAVWTP